MGIKARIESAITFIINALLCIKGTGKNVIEAARLFFLANLYSANMRALVKEERAQMNVANDILEIAVGLILIGSVEYIGINMIINNTFTGWDPNVKTMFTVVLVILAVIADIYVFMKAVQRKKGRR